MVKLGVNLQSFILVGVKLQSINLLGGNITTAEKHSFTQWEP
jgi:hypothetical protein